MAERRNKVEERGTSSCVGGMFRLGFGKLLHKHVETPNPFHPHCSQETTVITLLLVVHVVKKLLPCLFFSLLLSLLSKPSSFPHSRLLACLPRLCSPPPHSHFYVLLVYILLCCSRAEGVFLFINFLVSF